MRSINHLLDGLCSVDHDKVHNPGFDFSDKLLEPIRKVGSVRFGTTDVDAKRLAVSEARRSLGYTDEHR